ncbi:hypothetical protein [Mycolicibacterium thermoresistibile]
MTEQSPAVTLSHPPAAVLRVLNPALRTLLRTPVLAGAGKEFMVVHVTGRKSGKRYAIPLSAHWIDGELYAISSAGWKWNFRDGAPADVRHAGQTRPMRGELITDPAAVAELCHRSTQHYGPKKAQRMMGMKFREQRIPTLDEFTEAARREHLAAVRFTPAS